MSYDPVGDFAVAFCTASMKAFARLAPRGLTNEQLDRAVEAMRTSAKEETVSLLRDTKETPWMKDILLATSTLTVAQAGLDAIREH